MNNKEFDRSVAFTFYSEWAQDAAIIEEDYGLEGKAKFYDAIINYALFEIEPDMRPPIKYFWNTIKEKIDASQSHRAKGFAREDTEQTEAILKYINEHPGASEREIAKAVGCSNGKVNKVKQRHISTSNSTTIPTSTTTSVSVSMSTHDTQKEEERRREEKRNLKDLTEEEAKEIINKLANDVPYSQLYKEYNLKRGVVTKDFATEYRAAKEQMLFEERKIDYEFLAEYWQVADSNIAKARMKYILEKYPQYTHDQLMSVFHNNPKLSYEHFWDTVKKKRTYNWTSQQYEDGPVIPYPQWLHERISNDES